MKLFDRRSCAAGYMIARSMRPGALVLSYAYLTALFGWAVMRASLGDRRWWLFLPTSFAIYLFLPLPAVMLVALWARRPELWAGSVAAALLWSCLFGGLFLPRLPQAHAAGATLTIMSYNALGYVQHPDSVVGAIRASGADVVAMQELNPAVARAIQRELTVLYPYQELDPQPAADGMGVISRYPLQSTRKTLAGTWLGQPQILDMNFDGTVVALINLHDVSVEFDSDNWQAGIEQSVQQRDQNAAALANFVGAQSEPAIVAGDFNMSDQSTAYRVVTTVLADSWREAGFGLGHTFPGAEGPYSARPVIAGIAVPMWLIRIDYVFHSAHWRAITAHIGPWDQVSDHRPVMATLSLQIDEVK